MKIIVKDINDLKPYDNNAKLHPKEQIEQIKNSIKEFGNNDPIAIDEDNMIIEGHGRYQALKELGYQEVEVIVLEGLTEEQKNAYRIVHNQLTMNTDWDMEKLKSELNTITINMNDLGFSEDLLDEIQEDFSEAEEDNFDVDEAIKEIDEPKSKRGDIYKLGNHILMCGDSTKLEDVKRLTDNNKVDLVITDPPYNINVSNSQGMTIENDNMGDSEFNEFLTAAFECMEDVLKEGSSFYVWYASTEHINFESALNKAGLKVREQLIWVKNQFILGRQDYHWRHEPCLYGWKDGASHYFINDRTQSTVIDDSVDLDTISHEDLVKYVKQLHDTSTIIYENKPAINTDHPTMKPIPLIGRLVKNSSKKYDKVLDLFGGSGTTLIVCEQLNRSAYLMEYDPKYCDVIIRRWEELTGKKVVLLNG